jgi:hypothetical protein
VSEVLLWPKQKPQGAAPVTYSRAFGNVLVESGGLAKAKTS